MTYRMPGWRTILVTAVAALLASLVFAFSRPVEMLVDGERVESDVPPVTVSSKVYVPLRTIADALGAETMLDEKTGRIDVVRGNQSLRVKLGDVHATLNGMPFTLKHAPFRVRGRVMIGLKVVANAFGVRVNYDSRTARIDVLTPGIGQANAPASNDTTQ